MFLLEQHLHPVGQPQEYGSKITSFVLSALWLVRTCRMWKQPTVFVVTNGPGVYSGQLRDPVNGQELSIKRGVVVLYPLHLTSLSP